MSLDVDFQNDGSVIVRCGEEQVRISAPSTQGRAVARHKIDIPDLVPRPGPVIIQVAPGPSDAVGSDFGRVGAILGSYSKDSSFLSVNYEPYVPRTIDIGKITQIARDNIQGDFLIDLHLPLTDE